MSMELAKLAEARPFMGASMYRELIESEIRKGCDPDLAPVPVCLEPPYRDFRAQSDAFGSVSQPRYVPATVPVRDDLVRLAVWLSPRFPGDWRGAEDFLKQLMSCHHPMGFELTGNGDRITLSILCHRTDCDVVNIAFHNTFPECQLTATENPLLDQTLPLWREVEILEFFPDPPYTHLFTRPAELVTFPVGFLLNALAGLDSNVIGIYQVLFAPVDRDHNWHRNIGLFLDLEYNMATLMNAQPGSRYAQQVPTAELRGMALDADQKSHNDKPIFAAVARVALVRTGVSEKALEVRALACFLNRIQHGGRPLRVVTGRDFCEHLSEDALKDMLRLGLTYRPGYILNSLELSSMVHSPPPRRRLFHHTYL